MKTTRTLLLPLAIALAVAACAKPADDAAAPAADAAPAATAPAAEAPAAPATDAAPIQAASGTYTIDPTHTDVLAQWTHFGFSNPSAHFGAAEGSIVYDAEDVTRSSVQVTLPLTGLNSFVKDFDDHLRSADFFDAGKFPSATFKSTSVQAAGANKLTVTGDLTVKDITKPVTLDVTLNGAGEHPMKKVPAIGFDATATILRSDFGVGAYAPNVSDEVKLRITTEATAAKAE
ncbi:YceI family protein [Xanthomonas sp. XNM01]|uniref:YceI family protein n=1 Tax=Xanthomonas sp. XNM01 TaxID=2769289 RepID=UPI00177C28CF|nr:YceI family protein [Xanthomonas sp. XNM01]MBD9370257.1 polyisoprenoid-binding protein [Xanthomonas sp. XNM01]